MNFKELSIGGKIALIEKFAADIDDVSELECPESLTYTIETELDNANRQSRFAALKTFKQTPIVKLAFDTRRVDQEHERNPRANLQYWHRADPFIDTEDEKKLSTFAKLMKVLKSINEEYGNQPEWFDSYARVLYDNVSNALRIKQADLDIFKPQLAYLEQLIFARYRLNMDDLNNFADSVIKERIISKDENLLKRGDYLNHTGLESKGNENKKNIIVDGNTKTTQQSLVEALFGDGSLRRSGDGSVTRTITITIRDSAD